MPITQSTGVSVVAISFALAVGQFVFGAAQPIFGAIADKYGAVKVVVGRRDHARARLRADAVRDVERGLLLTMGVLSAAGAAAGSFSILIGIAAQRLPPEKRSFAAGLINAGGSIGQFVFAPVVQFIIGAAGWASAMFATAFAALLTIPSGAAAATFDSGRLQAPPRAWRRCRTLTLERAAARRAARSELPVSARRLLHLRLSRRVSWSRICRTICGCAA